MLVRASIAVIAGAIALAGAAFLGSERSDEVQGLQQRVAALELRVSRLEHQRQADVERALDIRVALDGLDEATRRLANGATDIDAQLAHAEAVLTGQAAEDVRAARTALNNEDLGLARQYLGQAIYDARYGGLLAP